MLRLLDGFLTLRQGRHWLIDYLGGFVVVVVGSFFVLFDRRYDFGLGQVVIRADSWENHGLQTCILRRGELCS